jgi:hypothetical protein
MAILEEGKSLGVYNVPVIRGDVPCGSVAEPIPFARRKPVVKRKPDIVF